MSQDTFVDPSDQYAMQHIRTALAPLSGLRLDADANEERKPILPPSELIMGPGKCYHATVAFFSQDPKKRWKLHTEKNGVAHKVPFFGAQVQYQVCDSPNGQFDGFTVGEYIMTMVSYNGTCGTQGLLQAIGAWNAQLATEDLMMKALNDLMLRTPKIGIHVDWSGQHITIEEILGPDGKPAVGPDGKPKIEKKRFDVPGLESWRGFAMLQPPEHVGKIPPSRIELKDPQGNPRVDLKGRPIIYTAKADVVRRECILVGNTFGAAQAPGFGAPSQQAFAPPQQQAPPPASYPVNPNPALQQPYQQPQQQQYPQFQPQQQQPQQPQTQAPQQQPLFQPQQPQQQQAPQQGYGPPQPTTPWQADPPAWVTGR